MTFQINMKILILTFLGVQKIFLLLKGWWKLKQVDKRVIHVLKRGHHSL